MADDTERSLNAWVSTLSRAVEQTNVGAESSNKVRAGLDDVVAFVRQAADVARDTAGKGNSH